MTPEIHTSILIILTAAALLMTVGLGIIVYVEYKKEKEWDEHDDVS